MEADIIRGLNWYANGVPLQELVRSSIHRKGPQGRRIYLQRVGAASGEVEGGGGGHLAVSSHDSPAQARGGVTVKVRAGLQGCGGRV